MAKDRAYQILETLYQGNKTIIYRAIRQADRSKMILKVLVNEYPDPLELARFRKEFQRVRSLKIEGVPQFVEFGKLDTRYFISLKDDGSISLSQFFSGQVPGIPIFLRIAIQLSEILDQLHQKGIIHKDLKPDNILIQPDQARVTLIDFGLSSHVQGEAPDLVSQGSWEGSLAYLSPEQSGRMNRPIDHRSDFYALGISFFEMLTGSLPFQASSPLEWVHVQLAREVPDPRDIRKDIPEMLVRIIRKLSAKMAEDRYQSAAGLKFDLEECLRQWQETKKIASFPLGARDISRTFRIPFRPHSVTALYIPGTAGD